MHVALPVCLPYLHSLTLLYKEQSTDGAPICGLVSSLPAWASLCRQEGHWGRWENAQGDPARTVDGLPELGLMGFCHFHVTSDPYIKVKLTIASRR